MSKTKVTKEQFEETLSFSEEMMAEGAALEVTMQQLGIDYDDLPYILEEQG